MTRIDATDLDQDEKLDLVSELADSIERESELRHGAMSGQLSDEKIEETIEWFGDDLAEAMGRAYHTRDIIEKHTSRNATVEPTGKEWTFPSTTVYEFTIVVEGVDG